MTDATRTRMEPPADPELSTFWEGTKERQLLLPRCTDCGTTFWHPRTTCPACLSDRLEWRPSVGTGAVHAVSVMSRPERYAVVLVDLDAPEGPDGQGVRLMSNAVGIDPDDVTVGMRVRLTWEELSDGRHLWLFEPGG